MAQFSFLFLVVLMCSVFAKGDFGGCELKMSDTALIARATELGFERFGRVDDHVYRGSAPLTEEKIQFLVSIGVTAILSLENMPWHTERERQLARKYGITFYNVHIDGSIFEPTEKSVDEAVGILRTTPGKTYVHCALGRDRTSVVVGEYRVQTHEKTKEEAWSEMKAYGFSEDLWLKGLKKYWDSH